MRERLPRKKPAQMKMPPAALRAMRNTPRVESKHPSALPGMRWVASGAMSPANVLQLMHGAGNRAVASALRRFATTADGDPKPKIYEAARRGDVPRVNGLAEDARMRDALPPRGADAAEAMARHGPEAGEWRFRFVTAGGSGIALFWVTLANYRNRQRDILIDAETREPLLANCGDLDAEERNLLIEWAAKMLADLLANRDQKPILPSAGGGPSGEEDEEDPFGDLFGDDGGGDDSDGLGALASALLGAAGSFGSGQAGNAGGKGGAAGSGGSGGGSGGSG